MKNYAKKINTQAVYKQGLGNLFQDMRHKIMTKFHDLKNKVLSIAQEADALLETIISDNAEIKETQSETTAMLKIAAVSLPEKKEAFLRAKQDYFAFRALHNITRDPVVPDKLLAFMSFALMIFIEAGINTPFLMGAHLTAGASSAILLAVLISFTNVFLSALFGYLGRWKNYGIDAHDPSEFRAIRIKARLAFWGYVLVTIWLILLVGMVRVQGTIDGLEHNFSAYAEVFLTIEPLFLVITASCMAIASYLKSMGAFDDPYPELGKKYRVMQQAQDDVLEYWHEDYHDISEQFNEIIDDKKDALEVQKKAITQHGKLVQDFHQSKRQFEEAIDTEKSQFLAQIEDMVNYYKTASGDDYCISEAEIERLTCFEHLLTDIHAPTPLEKPDGFHQLIRKVENDKQTILGQYDQLLDDIFKLYKGAQS